MPRKRSIIYHGREWRLSELAAQWSMKPQTLAARLDRGLTVDRALATGICSAADAGRRGFDTGWGARR
jgi:hypothetical protein